MFVKIKTPIQKYLQKNPQKREGKMFLLIKKEWKKQTNKETQKNVIVYDYKQNKLTLKTKNPTWRNEISMQKDTIKLKLLKNPKIKIEKILVN